MKKVLHILLFSLLMFIVLLNHVNAREATCYYEHTNSVGGEKWEIVVSIDNNLNVSYQFNGNGFYDLDKGTTAIVANDLIDTDGNFVCPSQIRYKIASSNSRKTSYGFTFDTNSGYGLSISLKNSNIDNTASEDELTIVNVCNYEDNTYKVNVFSDGSLKAYRVGYSVTINDTKGLFSATNCPNVYIRSADGGNRGPNVAFIDTAPFHSGQDDEEFKSDNYEDMFDNNCRDFAPALRIGGRIIFIAKIILPLIIIVKSSLSLIHVVTKGDSGELKKQATKTGISLAAAVMVFLVPTFLNAIFSLVDNAQEANNGDAAICRACVFDPGSNTCTDAID